MRPVKTLGLIVEYNPFHNGHAHHLAQAKALTGATHTVAVMSGHFVQRGEPALFDKWVRTQMALDAGVDLVIELPVTRAVSGADDFAAGAVGLLHGLGFVEEMVFGSESGDLRGLETAAEILELDGGHGYAAASARALAALQATSPLDAPNDTLGLSYLVAARKLKTDLRFHAIHRIGSGYHDEEIRGKIASATAVRRAFRDGKPVASYVPKTVRPLLLSPTLPTIDDLFPYFRYEALTRPELLSRIHEVGEGLENRLIAAARDTDDFTSFATAAATKRYTDARIRRILIKSLLQIDRRWAALPLTYARVLGFGPAGRDLLARAKKTSSLKILPGISPGDVRDHPLLSRDVLATDLLSLVHGGLDAGTDFTRPPLQK
jgi:predicted nucleotidyltransferase